MTTLHEAVRALLAKLDVYCGPAPVWKVEQEALRAALSADSERVSVPRVITNAQRKAIITACEDHVALFPNDGILRADRIYNAMLAAAEGKS